MSQILNWISDPKGHANAFALFFAVTFSSCLHADEKVALPNRVDFSARFLARTYSPGASLNPQIGYAQSIWGDPTTPWHGFVRPYLIGVVSPSLHEEKVGLELFPVSILGVDLRRTISRRFATTLNQDCNQVQCLGELNYNDLSFQSYLGFGDYFASLRWTRTFFDALGDRTRSVYEAGASVLLSPDGEAGDNFTFAIGKNLAEKVQAGLLLQVGDYHAAGNHQDAQYLLLKTDCSGFGLEDLDATVGLGRFYSSRNVADFSAIIFLTYARSRAIGFGR